MELRLVQIEDDFQLYNENDEKIVSFDVEWNKETALISYVTKEKFRNKGFASYGLNLLKEVLFNDKNILFLELINLSGDYSRKVAENAGFFSPYNTLDYYICLNPHAEEIINGRLCSLENSSNMNNNSQKLLNKIKNLRIRENKSKEKMHNKLEQLLQQRELIEESDYKKYIESEINHLERILKISQDIEKKKR